MWHTVLAGKVTIAKALFTIAPIMYLGIENLTGSVGWGLVASAFFTMLGVVASNRSKVIAAKAAALALSTEAKDRHDAHVMEAMTRLHQQEIDYWKNLVAKQNKVEILIRVTKHRAFGAYQAGLWAVREREEMLKDAGVSFIAFKPESIADITGDEDKAMILSLFPEVAK